MLSHFSHVWLFLTPWTVALQVPLSMRFSSQEYWGGMPFPSPEDPPDPGIEPASLTSPALQVDSLPSELQYVRPFDIVSHLLVISSVGFSLFSFISVSICVPSVDLSLVHWNFLCAICWVVLFSFSKNNKKVICWSPNPSISEYDCFGYRVCFGDLFKK